MSDSHSVIKQFFLTQSSHPVGEEELERSRNLIEDEVIDSLGVMLLVSFLSDRFSIEFDPEEIHAENFESLQSIASLVDRKLDSKA